MQRQRAERCRDHGQRGEQADWIDRQKFARPGQRRIAAQPAAGAQEQRETEKPRNHALQRTGIETAGQTLRKREQSGQQRVVDTAGIEPAFQTVMQREQGLASDIQGDPAKQRNHAHPQRRAEAMPDRQIMLRQRRLQHRAGCQCQDRLHGQRRQHADQQADRHQHLHRHLHPAWRFMRRAWQVDGVAVEEHVVDEAQRIGHREYAGKSHRDRQQPAELHHGRRTDRLGEEHFLRQKTIEQRHAGHRRRRHHGQRRGIGHEFPQAVDAAHVAAAGFVVDDAGGHEQRRLENGVVDDVKHPGYRRQRRADAEQRGDQAEMADCRIGEQTFQVVLEQRDEGAGQQRDQADSADQMRPFPGSRQRREQPREQKHAGFDHGRRMQIGRHRGGRRHRMRQPEMERKLRRFGERAEQNQDQGRQIQRMRADQIAGSQNHRQLVTAGDFAQQQDAAEQGQAAGAGDRQRHAGAVTRFLALLPVADEQEGRQAGQLPEDQQLDQVFRQHHAQHRAHEQQQIGVQPAQAVALGQVIAGVKNDQQADAEDQAGEQQAETVEAEGQIEADLRQPDDALHQRIAGQHRRDDAGQQAGRAEANQTGGPGGG